MDTAREPEWLILLRRVPWRAVAVAGLLLAAGVLRLWQIQDQSLTTDEFVTYYFEPAATLAEYRDINAFRLSDNPPVYGTALWYWIQLIGNSPVRERLFSVGCGVLTGWILFLLGRRAYGWYGGVLALTLYALSPFHIFHDQGIRPYGLLMTLAAGSLLLTDQLARPGRWRRWLLPHWGINVLLVYTHPMGGLVLLFEGIWLLVLWRRQLLRVVAWAVPLLLAVAPVVAGIAVPEEDPRWSMPDWSHAMANTFGLDTIYYNIELTPSHENWAYLLPRQDLIQGVYAASAIALALLFAVAALGGIVAAWRRQRGGEGGALPWLLLLVAVLPAPLLAMLSQVLEPMPMPRYTLFSAAGLYVLAGGAVCSLGRPWLRRAAGVVLCGLAGWQLLWLMPAGARTEFYSATAYVAERRVPEEPVYTTLSPDMFYIHFPIKVDLDLATPSLLGFHTRGTAPYVPKHTMRSVASEALRYFQALPRDARGSRAVWVIVMRLYEYGQAPLLEQELARRGLAFEARHWYAYEGISVYRITAPNPLPATVAPEAPIDWAGFLDAQGISLPAGASPEMAASSLNASLDRRPERFGSASEFASLAFIVGSTDLPLAQSIADAGLRAHPDEGGLYVARAYIRLGLGDIAGGQADAARALERLPENAMRAYGRVLTATVAGDFAEARAAFARLNRLSGGHLQTVIEQGLAVALGGGGPGEVISR